LIAPLPRSTRIRGREKYKIASGGEKPYVPHIFEGRASSSPGPSDREERSHNKNGVITEKAKMPLRKRGGNPAQDDGKKKRHEHGFRKKGQ